MTKTKKARALGDTLADGGDDLRQRVEDRTRELVDHGEEALQEVGANVRSKVRKRPVIALVVAGSIGLLLGVLLQRHR